MRILILYFSATGNTAFLCHELAELLREAGLDTELVSIEEVPPNQLPAHDLLVLGFPVYGLEPPPLMSDYVAAMPAVTGRGAMVLTTQGVLAAGAPRRGLERLALRGYSIHGHVAIDMPFSDGMMVMRKDNAYVVRAQTQDHSGNAKLVAFCERIIAMRDAVVAGTTLEELATRFPLGLPLNVAGPVLGALMQGVFNLAATRFHADERCVRCGLCERICPTGNITVTEEGVQFGRNCQLCVRCLHQCPEEAIQFGMFTSDKARWRGPGGTYRP